MLDFDKAALTPLVQALTGLNEIYHRPGCIEINLTINVAHHICASDKLKVAQFYVTEMASRVPV